MSSLKARGRFSYGLAFLVVLVMCMADTRSYAQATNYPAPPHRLPDTRARVRGPVAPSPAGAQATAQNGGFETGTFSNWTVQNTCTTGSAGNWFVYTGTTSPLSAFTIPAPPGGSFAAITDQQGPGTHILHQDLALEAGSTHTLTMTLYFNNRAAANVTPANLNLSCLDPAGNPNQQYRVDIIRTTAAIDSVSASDILLTIFWTANLPTSQLSLAPTQFTANLTPFAGQTVRLRVAEVDNQFFYQAGVDNVVLTSEPILAGTPGLPYPQLAETNDQKAGSVLFYNLLTSVAATPASQNTRFNITNINPSLSVAVHLFFVDGSNCSVSDKFVCLTPNQTMTFLASELDPGTTGYLVAIASNENLGCPLNFNYLIGDEFVKLATGHAANLGAEAISAINGPVSCNANSVTAQLNFNGVGYARVPRVVALSNILSRADGNDTLFVLNRFGGDLLVAASTLGSLFGILYDDAETPASFNLSGSCQLRGSLNNLFPRTVPRFETKIPAGQSGWLKIFPTADIGVFGASINFNANSSTSAGAFNQGKNLHKLKLIGTATLTVPIFPPGCGTGRGPR